MSGGTITGNRSNEWGGGIYLQERDGVVLNLNGGVIQGNTSVNNGAGVYVSGEAVVNVSGGPAVKENLRTVDGVETLNNINLTADAFLDITGELTEGAHLCVSRSGSDGSGVITRGLSGNGGAASFFSDRDQFVVVLQDSGEAALETAHTVTFEPGDENAEGEMPELRTGNTLTLPDCDYNVPDKAFKAWSVKIGDADAVIRPPGETADLTADSAVTALWRIAIPFGTRDFTVPAGTTAIEESAFEGVAVTVAVICENCASIGDYAFRNCASLTMIRIPAGCRLGADVFDGCGLVYIYSAAGSDAEDYCLNHDNCVFVEETQD